MIEDNNAENEKKNLIVDLAFKFSLDIIVYTEQLEQLKKYNLSNQLFRSGTSIGANINESQHQQRKQLQRKQLQKEKQQQHHQ